MEAVVRYGEKEIGLLYQNKCLVEAKWRKKGKN